MHIPLLLFAAVAALIVGAWSWLGAPVAMPFSPLAQGEKLYCVSYAPFRGAQSPLDASTHIDARQIDDDLARLSAVTDCVRTYSIEHGLDQVPALAARHGLKVMQGLWLSSDPAKNRRQIEVVVALANQHRDVIRSVVVGNEVLLRGEMAVPELAAIIRQVKAAVPMPVTYADVWEFWLRSREIYAAVDFVTVHILPYWEDFPIAAAKAAAHVDEIRRQVVAAFPDKEVLIGETGWPSAGRMRAGALPSPSNQARVLHEVLNAARAGQYRVNVIEAFDQPWKRALEGTVGGHWGLYDDGRQEAKFAWGAPVSDHPQWHLQAIRGVLAAVLVFLAAGAARPRPKTKLPASRWLAVAVVAAAAGIVVGLAVEKMQVESLGTGGWLRSLVMAVVALMAPVGVAMALARQVPLAGFARLLGGRDGRPSDRLATGLGVTFIMLCVIAAQVALGLVFDPRYKDFPNAALGGPVAAYLVLAIVGERSSPERGTAELVMAAVLGLSAVYIAFNEGFANWQAQVFVGLLIALVFMLLRLAGVRKPI